MLNVKATIVSKMSSHCAGGHCRVIMHIEAAAALCTVNVIRSN